MTKSLMQHITTWIKRVIGSPTLSGTTVGDSSHNQPLVILTHEKRAQQNLWMHLEMPGAIYSYSGLTKTITELPIIDAQKHDNYVVVSIEDHYISDTGIINIWCQIRTRDDLKPLEVSALLSISADLIKQDDVFQDLVQMVGRLYDEHNITFTFKMFSSILKLVLAENISDAPGQHRKHVMEDSPTEG